VWDRGSLISSLAELGRFPEASEHVAEERLLAERTHDAYTVTFADRDAGRVHLRKGDWAKARPLFEHAIAVARTGNVVLMLPQAVAASAWALAQLGEVREASNRLQEGVQLLERLAARGFVGQQAWSYSSLGCAGLLLGRLDEAQRLGDEAIKSSPRHPGFAA